MNEKDFNENNLRQMIIYDVRMDEESNAFVLILVDAEKKIFLPIWIGQFEATSILLELRDIKPERPFTHDLLRNVINNLGGKVKRVTITEIRNRTFYAIISIQKNGDLIDIDSRPSDAIALAVRERVPIFAEEEVLEVAGIKLDSLMSEEEAEQPELFNEELSRRIEEFKKFLDEISPEDFKNIEE